MASVDHPTASSVTPLRIRKNSLSSQASDSNPSTVSDNTVSDNSSNSQHSDYPFSAFGSMAHSHSSPLSNLPIRAANASDALPSSPSPYSPSKANSPLAFWQGRDLYDQKHGRENSPSVGRRSSIEKLKRASRVQNNAKLFQEAEARHQARPLSFHAGQPSSPLPSPRPGRVNIARDSLTLREKSRIPLPQPLGSSTPALAPPKATTPPPPVLAPKPATPVLSSPNVRLSPTKSSLLSSYRTNSFDTENGTFSEGEGSDSVNRSPTRRPKSVTFDKEAPEVLEYEAITPDPSVDGSPCMMYDSDEEDDDDELENTPVIEPEGWPSDTQDCITPSHRLADAFQPGPLPNGGRPLPPIPGSRMETDSPLGGRPLPTIPLRQAAPAQSSESVTQDGEDGVVSSSGLIQSSNDVGEQAGLGITVEQEKEHGEGHVDEEMSPVVLQDRDSDSDASPDVVQPGSENTDLQGQLYEPPRLSRESIRRQVEERRQQSDEPETGIAYGYAETTDESPVKSEASEEELDVQTVPEIDYVRERPASRFSTRSPDPDITDSEVSGYNDHEDDEPKYGEPEEEDHGTVELEEQHTGDPAPKDTNYIQEVILETGPEELTLGPDDVEDNQSESVTVSGSPKAGEDSVNSQKNDAPSNTISEGGLDVLQDDPTPTPSAPVSPQQARELPLPLEPSRVPEQARELPTPMKQAFVPEQTRALPVPVAQPQQVRELLPPLDHSFGAHDDQRMSLPDFTSVLGNEGLGLKDFMTPSPPLPPAEPVEDEPARRSSREHFEEQPEDEEDTGSVIRHKIYHSDAEESETDTQEQPSHDRQAEERLREHRPFSPVEEAVATIRAPGGKLKTRASATPTDMAAMAAVRRQVSGDQGRRPPMPRVPDGYRSEGDFRGSGSDDEETDDEIIEPEDSANSSLKRKGTEKGTRKSSALPALGEFEFDLNMDDLTTEFDRVIEKQKRGYLMRQNTRVIHASSRDLDEEEKSPPRPGHARGQSWSVEPWRSSQRRRSQRESSTGTLRKRPSTGPVPPLPGKEGVTSKRLPSVDEDDLLSRHPSGSGEEPGAERGRLFVKVLGVKDLTLPLPQGQPTYFCLTLDNGLHCVTTSWLELGKNAPIGQEFELVVLNDLEFQLTLQTKIEQPPPPPPKAQVKPPVVKHKQSTFSKVFSTPRKKKQLEQQYQEQLQQERQQQQERQATPPPTTAWDLLHGLVARDGSFARSYICLKDFESEAYGRPLTTDVHCFNEWAVDTASVNSKKGMQAGLQPARKAPYKIGKLEIQLLFVPKPKNSTDRDLPKSMNSAIREMKEAEAMLTRQWEGTLSQQGGDCPYWRRRHFKLNGVRLTAYHEATRQPRATINLSKAVKLIDDRHSLVDPTVPGPGKSRRKSGFSEEEEGYMFVEEGFRIRFGNGEVIDFYADSAEDKRGWMKVLGETIGRVPDQRGWCQVVLAREAKAKTEKDRADAAAAKLRASHPQVRLPPQTRIAPAQHSSYDGTVPASAPRASRRPGAR